jgi:predicted phage terminase large subunit-like protein
MPKKQKVVAKNGKTKKKAKRALTYDFWVEELNKVPVDQQKFFIYDSLRSKKHLHIFGRYFFPHIIKGKNNVPECHLDLIKELSRREHGAIIFPRGFAKSTWEKIDTIHDIVYAIEPVILYVGAKLQDASFHFVSIKAELENNKALIDIYGDLTPDNRLGASSSKFRTWTNSHFETMNGVNVVARGAGKGRGVNIKGQRPTKIILDDIEEDEQVRSPERCMYLSEWLNGVIIPSLDAERGYIKMIGTVLAKHSEILKFHKLHGGIFRRAIEDGKSIWGNMWSLDKLEKRRKEIGSRLFEREYMNNPIDSESAIIKPQWILGNTWTQLNRPEEMQLVMAMDPQAGTTKTSDFYGIVVVGSYRNDQHRYVLSRYMGRKTKLEQAALFVRIWQTRPKQFTLCGVEKVLTQVAVYQLIIEWKSGKIDFPNVDNSNRNIPIVALTPAGKDKEARLEIHEASFERGEIHFHQSMVDFMDRLTAFPNLEHDDDIDALIYALDNSYRGVRFTNSVKSDTTNSEKKMATMGNIQKQQF